LASLHYFGPDEVRMAAARYHAKKITLRRLLAAWGLEAESLAGMVRPCRLGIDEAVDEPYCDARLWEFLNDNRLQEYVKARTGEARDLLREYLHSVGFLGATRVGVVDGHGEGLSALLLSRAVGADKLYPGLVDWYFFSLHNMGSDLDQPRVRGILYDWRRDGRNEGAIFGILGNALVEVFSHPNHGITVGYRRTHGKVVPVFGEMVTGEYRRVLEVQRGIFDYAKRYAAVYDLHNYDPGELLESVRNGLRRFIAFPPKGYLEALKDFFAVDDLVPRRSSRLVAELTLKDILTVKGLVSKLFASAWPQGSLGLSPVPGLNRLLNPFLSSGRPGYARMLKYKHCLQEWLHGRVEGHRRHGRFG